MSRFWLSQIFVLGLIAIIGAMFVYFFLFKKQEPVKKHKVKKHKERVIKRPVVKPRIYSRPARPPKLPEAKKHETKMSANITIVRNLINSAKRNPQIKDEVANALKRYKTLAIRELNNQLKNETSPKARQTLLYLLKILKRT
jgi:hypothetical protein